MSDPVDPRTDRTADPDTEPSSSTVKWNVPRWFRRVGTNSWLFIGTLLALAVVTALIAATRDITVPLAIGVFLAVVFVPAVNWLDSHGIKRGAGASIVLVGLVVIVGGAGYITADALAGQADVLSDNLRQATDEIRAWVDDLPIDTGIVDEADQTAGDAARVVRDGLATGVASALDSVAGLLAGLVLGTMVLFYFLKDGPRLTREWVDRRSEPAARDAARSVVEKSLRDVQSYFGGQTALAFVNGASIAVGVALIGVPGALAIGVVNFVGGYIPYLGAFIGGAFAVLMALGGGGVGLALAALAIVLVAQIVLENLLQPKLLGSSLNLYPLTILLATTLGGMVAGMVGLILAAPALAIGLELFHELKAVGFFSDEADERPDTALRSTDE